MSPFRIAFFTFGFATVFAIGLQHAGAAPGAAVQDHPSALGPGTLVYGPEDALFERMKGSAAH